MSLGQHLNDQDGVISRAQFRRLGLARRRRPDAVIHVAVEHPRKVKPVAGVRVHRLVDLQDRVRWNLSPPRLRIEEAVRSRQGRSWLTAVLQDLAEGTCSVLEHGYLVRVERAHGLPRGRRQGHERTHDGIVYRDVTYEPQRLVVELDGRLGHERFHDRADDLDRDLLAATSRLMTVRLGWPPRATMSGVDRTHQVHGIDPVDARPRRQSTVAGRSL